MAVGATDPVDVVRTFRVGEGRVHLFDIETAVGHLRVAGFAGGRRVLVVTGVASEAADAFVNTHGCAVVAGADLRAIVVLSGGSAGVGDAGRVALVTDGLALIGADLYDARAIEELREG